jgi:transcriptional regulator with XRE-family HTH domain
MKPEQIRAARGLLGWSAATLAARAGVGVSSLRNYERGGTGTMMAANMRAIRATLEAAGVVLLDGDSPGARLRVPPRRADIGVDAVVRAA